MSALKLSFVVEAVDKATSHLKAINQRIDAITEPARRVRASFNAMARESGLPRVARAAAELRKQMGGTLAAAGDLLDKVTLIGGAMAWAFKTQLLDPAAQFEKFRTVLETIEGSSEKAGKAMDWVSDFASRTPFELAEVMDSFVKLRAYGLDPTNGLLRTLGDTASAMGKPMMQAVEAIADAMTGENERLKEFGIRARVAGNRVAYEYTVAGKTMRKIANLNSRASIQATLEAIWNEKYAGAMDKQSRTWNGMMSNLSDQWTRFANLVMNAGLFDWLKDRLGGLLDTIDRMAADGSLAAMAKDVGEKLKTIAISLYQIGTAVATIMGPINDFVQLLGGWDVVLVAVAGAITGKLVWSLALLAKALWGVVAAFMATPAGWVVAAVTAIAAAVYLLYKHWGPIKDFFIGIWDNIKKAFSSGIDWVKNKILSIVRWIADKIVAFNNMMPEWVRDYTPQGMLLNAAANGLEGYATPSIVAAGGQQDVNVGGTLRIQIDSETGRARVTEMRTEMSSFDYDVYTGTQMVAP